MAISGPGQLAEPEAIQVTAVPMASDDQQGGLLGYLMHSIQPFVLSLGHVMRPMRTKEYGAQLTKIFDAMKLAQVHTMFDLIEAIEDSFCQRWQT